MARTHRRRLVLGVAALSLLPWSGFTATSHAAGASASSVVYDSYSKPGGYSMADWNSKWATPYGLGEMALSDTRTFSNGAFSLSATPFQTAYDFSVYDHIKFLATSTQAFPVPAKGTLSFAIDITAATPGAVAGRHIHGTYVQSGTAYDVATLEGQQAGATLHMVDFATGQLFDWFVSSHYAFTLYERLPSSVVNPSLPSTDPSYVGRSKMFTQIVDQTPIDVGSTHRYGISFVRNTNARTGTALWTLDGKVISRVDHVGVPLDRQGRQPLNGTYPSLGPGEEDANQISSMTIGQGLFSLLDAFPFQHPEAPELNVSIPTSERAFGQGVAATVDNVTVTTTSAG